MVVGQFYEKVIRIKKINLGPKMVGLDEPIFLIAEVGVNHNGEISIAKKLIDVAIKANVDAIKFQSYITENLILKDILKVDYQKESLEDEGTFYEMVKKFEFNKEDFINIEKYCMKKKIIFISTPFDEETVDWLEDLKVPCYKVSSGDLTNLPLLKKICEKNKPILLSTGMATLEEVKNSIDFIPSNGIEDLILFQCTTNYPTSYEDVNLNVIDTYKNEFPNLIVGFSDHSLGFEASIGAVVKGAKVIEKHITLDKNMDGPYHKASLDPKDLIEWVCAIRNIEKALGHFEKIPTDSELEIAKIARKSIVSIMDLKKGDSLKIENIAIKRPGTGISPLNLEQILGKKVNKNIPKDSIIGMEDLT